MAVYQREFASVAPSGAMQDIYKTVAGDVDALVNTLKPQSGQVGAAFFGRGRLLGLDAFDSPATFAGEFAKIVRSYAVEVLRHRGPDAGPDAGGANELGSTHGLLALLGASTWRSYPGVGLGTDLRLEVATVAAGALAVDNEVVHLAAFPAVAESARVRPETFAPPLRWNRPR
jgi:hypothetical protein